MFCHKCGNQITNEAAFCSKCGSKLIVENNVQQTVLKPILATAAITANEKNEITMGSVGNVTVGNGFAFYCSDLDITYYVKKERTGSKIIVESKSSKGEIFIDKDNAPKYLFADKDNLYFLLQEGNKLFKKNPKFIYACPHGSLTYYKLGTVEAEQIVCHGEYIYYVSHATKSDIFRIKKDGSDNKTFVDIKVWSDISVYNDKLYFRTVDNKNQLMCIEMDGQNKRNIGAIKPNEYFISNDVVYYPDLSFKSAMSHKLNYFNLVDGSAGTTSDIGGIALNVVNGCALTYPLNNEQLQQHPLSRVDIKNNTAIKYENIPAMKNFTSDRPTVNVANGMVYWGNGFGIRGRIPIDGGNFEVL